MFFVRSYHQWHFIHTQLKSSFWKKNMLSQQSIDRPVSIFVACNMHFRTCYDAVARWGTDHIWKLTCSWCSVFKFMILHFLPSNCRKIHIQTLIISLKSYWINCRMCCGFFFKSSKSLFIVLLNGEELREHFGGREVTRYGACILSIQMD